MTATPTTYTCAGCGATVYERSSASPRLALWAAHWDGRQWCGPCCQAAIADRKCERKAVLDAMPRCEYCTRRGTVKVGAATAEAPAALLCGRHHKQAVRMAGQRLPVLFHTVTGAEVRAILGDTR